MSNEDGTKIIYGRTPESAAMLANVKRAMAITATLNRLTFNDNPCTGTRKRARNPFREGTPEFVFWVATFHLTLTELREEAAVSPP